MVIACNMGSYTNMRMGKINQRVASSRRSIVRSSTGALYRLSPVSLRRRLAFFFKVMTWLVSFRVKNVRSVRNPDRIVQAQKPQRQVADLITATYPPMTGPHAGPAMGDIENTHIPKPRYSLGQIFAIAPPPTTSGHDANTPAKKRKIMSPPILGANAHAMLKIVRPAIEKIKGHLTPYSSEYGAQRRGPKQYPPRKINVESLMTSSDTPKCAAVFGIKLAGSDDVIVDAIDNAPTRIATYARYVSGHVVPSSLSSPSHSTMIVSASLSSIELVSLTSWGTRAPVSRSVVPCPIITSLLSVFGSSL